MRANLKLQFPSDPRFLVVLRGVIGRVAKIAGFSGKEIGNLKLAVDEAVTNIIRHSLKNDFDRTIEVDLVLAEKRLEVILRDDGAPAGAPDLKPLEPSPCRKGGVGIHLIHKCIDKVTYERLSNDLNQLSLVKYLKP